MLVRSLLTVAGSALFVAASAHAGCKSCQSNAPASMAPIAAPVMSAPMMSHSWSGGGRYSGHEPFQSYRSDHTPYASGHVNKIAAPPGTIGQTYQLPSSPVPAEMHPRASVLKVLAEGATDVQLISTNPMRTEDEVEGYQDAETGVWVFKTESLIPGNAQIYRVRAKYGDGVAHQDRYVRLIMGRVVALAY